MNIYVGNLSYDVQDKELNDAFSAFGRVTSARVIGDMYTGQSKGFGFVEMEDKQEAQAAINSLNGTQLSGRTITVNEARPKPERSSSGGGDRNGGGGARKRGW